MIIITTDCRGHADNCFDVRCPGSAARLLSPRSLKQAALKAGGQAGATLQQLKAKVRMQCHCQHRLGMGKRATMHRVHVMLSAQSTNATVAAGPIGSCIVRAALSRHLAAAAAATPVFVGGVALIGAASHVYRIRLSCNTAVTQDPMLPLVPLLLQALERAQAGKASAATHGLHTE